MHWVNCVFRAYCVKGIGKSVVREGSVGIVF